MYYDKIQLIKSEVNDEVAFKKYLENINETFVVKDDQENKDNNIEDTIDDDGDIEITIDDNKTKIVKKDENDYIGFLEIKKLNLMLGFYDKKFREQ